MNICEGNSLVKMTDRRNRHSLCLHRKGWKNLLFVFDQWTWKHRRENILCKPSKNIFVGSENHLFFLQNRKKETFSNCFYNIFLFFPVESFAKTELKFLHILSCFSINKIITKLTTKPYFVISRVWKSLQRRRRAMQFHPWSWLPSMLYYPTTQVLAPSPWAITAQGSSFSDWWSAMHNHRSA